MRIEGYKLHYGAFKGIGIDSFVFETDDILKGIRSSLRGIEECIGMLGKRRVVVNNES